MFVFVTEDYADGNSKPIYKAIKLICMVGSRSEVRSAEVMKMIDHIAMEKSF